MDAHDWLLCLPRDRWLGFQDVIIEWKVMKVQLLLHLILSSLE
jgi:hypothetical protein